MKQPPGANPSAFDIEYSRFDISDAVQTSPGCRTRKMFNVEFPSLGRAPTKQQSHDPTM